MRALPLILLFTALSAPAQVAAPQPAWMEVFKKVFGPQAHGVALGSLDQEVEKSWAAALVAGPRHSSFETAAQQTSQYFASQGYEVKAEKVLRQAIAAAGRVEAEPAERDRARSLNLSLAQRLTQDHKFVAAVGVVQELLDGAKGTSDPGLRISALMQLAQLREQMGEFETVEALLQEAKALQSAPAAVPPRGAIAPTGAIGFMRMGSFGGPGGSADLAGFYQRQGDVAKAEALFKKDLDDAKAPEEMFRALQAYAYSR